MNRSSWWLVSVLVVTVVACAGRPDTAVEPTTRPTIPPTTQQTPPTTTSTTAATTGSPPTPIDERLADELLSYPAPGALGLVRVGADRSFGSSGSADVHGTPISYSTTFRIASITKPVVAALVLDAVERGELRLDDPVDVYVPGILRADQPVTVRMLLDHTSGIFDELNDGDPAQDGTLLADAPLRAEFDELVRRYTSGEQVIVSDRLFVALAEAHDRYFPPGEGFHYSNTNYQVAAMALEAATGQTLAELLHSRIVEPLGLRSTTIAPPDLASPDLRGYGTSVDDGTLVDITDDLVTFGNGGNGGIVSTADDLLTILQAIVGGDLIDTDLITEMERPTPQSGATYGLGLASYYLTCGTFYGHEGGLNGTASIAIVSSDGADGTVIALNMRNGTDPELPALADELLCPRLGE